MFARSVPGVGDDFAQRSLVRNQDWNPIVAQAHPTNSADFLATAVKAVIHLEKTKSGAALLQKLSSLPAGDIAGLDRLLTEWTVKDALRVLDETYGRISVIETIRRLADDPHTDELHTLHPLILRSRWLFGPEFESQEYWSNVTLQTVARELFKRTEASSGHASMEDVDAPGFVPSEQLSAEQEAAAGVANGLGP